MSAIMKTFFLLAVVAAQLGPAFAWENGRNVGLKVQRRSLNGMNPSSSFDAPGVQRRDFEPKLHRRTGTASDYNHHVAKAADAKYAKEQAQVNHPGTHLPGFYEKIEAHHNAQANNAQYIHNNFVPGSKGHKDATTAYQRQEASFHKGMKEHYQSAPGHAPSEAQAAIHRQHQHAFQTAANTNEANRKDGRVQTVHVNRNNLPAPSS